LTRRFIDQMEVDPSGNPVGPPVAGFVQAGNVIPHDLAEVPMPQARLPNADPNNFGPRLGFAFAPFASSD
jgi:hypothetical protein